MTNKELERLREEGAIGLDLSPGNAICAKAHTYISTLMHERDAMRAVVEAARQRVSVAVDAAYHRSGRMSQGNFRLRDAKKAYGVGGKYWLYLLNHEDSELHKALAAYDKETGDEE